jgi:tetratricopeptide (TPR) repeat protein
MMTDPRLALLLIIPLFDTEKPAFSSYLQFIDLCLDSEHYEIASSFLKKTRSIATHSSERVELVVRQAQIYASRGDIEHAINSLKSLKNHKRYCELGYIAEANIHLKFLKDRVKYCEILREFCENVQTVRAYELFGDALKKLGDMRMAADAFQSGLDLEPSSDSIIPKIIHTLVQSHRFENAVAKFVNSVGLIRGIGIGAVYLIDLMIKLDRNDEAEQCII